MATVELDDVKKRFGTTQVLHGITTSIEDGEFIVIVGPSGCGKSTLLRMVAGLESVSSGEIRIDGKRVNEVEPMDRDIAMVFQNYALYPHMSVRQNMGYGLKIAGLSKDKIESKVQEAATAASARRVSGPTSQTAFRWSAPAGCHGAGHCARTFGVSVR
jgi:sn-glycerol 3-phosphate transport system ATP-binding protein